ncbi:transcription initiation factor TFIID 23-30kDa subunit-domain-containing protein [Zychaea mexicana]|uniref:transcription initiation factor TFIID 23-30kDa subunit-domain-containing protein n=1 Tax=Zychaea mexicana TaxID=64656 RepID=UPI0022FDE1DE|nr:transcription initiation factor TFIID 23-30kDa subunit-domain-containing protein [Zychaea mexicana]KAI9488151.1 transcription initiation factor TFIID 23-30kDa subunit-domain-containing protein [Zychaea mexicana]
MAVAKSAAAAAVAAASSSPASSSSAAVTAPTQPVSTKATPALASGSASATPEAPGVATATGPPPPQSTETDLTKREKTLAEFLAMMDSYTPIIPDAVTDYYLSRTGFDCDDVRIKRLLALAAQKFVADIATDAFQYCKVRQSGNRKTGKVSTQHLDSGSSSSSSSTVLTMEDLSQALAEYGVNVKKPDYYS